MKTRIVAASLIENHQKIFDSIGFGWCRRSFSMRCIGIFDFLLCLCACLSAAHTNHIVPAHSIAFTLFIFREIRIRIPHTVQICVKSIFQIGNFRNTWNKSNLLSSPFPPNVTTIFSLCASARNGYYTVIFQFGKAMLSEPVVCMTKPIPFSFN